jgi:hypothetical protein
MAKFPASPSYTGFHAPSRLEDLEIEGEGYLKRPRRQ